MSGPQFTMSQYARREDLLSDAVQYYEARCKILEQQRDELLSLLNAVQSGQEFTQEFCKTLDETIARIEEK